MARPSSVSKNGGAECDKRSQARSCRELGSTVDSDPAGSPDLLKRPRALCDPGLRRRANSQTSPAVLKHELRNHQPLKPLVVLNLHDRQMPLLGQHAVKDVVQPSPIAGAESAFNT